MRVQDLCTYFYTEAGVVRALDGVSFSVGKNESLGLVGESGSGKTVSVLSVLRVVPRPGRIVSGSIQFDGVELLGKPEEEMRKIRGKEIGYVSQDPNSSLDPLFTVGSQLVEVIRTHNPTDKATAREAALKLLKTVEMPEPEARMDVYPFELSGGMRQRVAIARALASNPKLLIADEPTTNLDVTIQAQVVTLLKNLQSQLSMSLILITHDMGLIAEMTQRVVVMYAGRVAESAETKDLFRSPRHPYTSALLKAVPRVDREKLLVPIPGNIPNLIDPPSGCRYHPRCRYAIDVCKEKIPPLERVAAGREASCHRWKELALEAG